MQHTEARTAKRPFPSPRRYLLPTILILSVVLLASACSLSDDVRAAMGLPTSQTTPARADAQANLTAPRADGQPGPMTVTAQQRDYLDALTAAGVEPSSDLLALSIGSYVCQARAAKQNDQAVWDFVVPLVRSDVRAAHSGSVKPAAAEVNAVTADYIRIATERLC